MVEFDPSSQWYNASLTIAAGWLESGGKVSYNAFAESPDYVRSQLVRLGVDVQQLESSERLQIVDWYTVTLGQKSKEKISPPSLKVNDITIWFAKDSMQGPPDPNEIVIADNQSVLARFNDERIWIEFHLTRTIPGLRTQKITAVRGVLRDIHSSWVYKQLEGAVDGVIDCKLDETSEAPRDLMRIRMLRNASFERRWRPLVLDENLKVRFG